MSARRWGRTAGLALLVALLQACATAPPTVSHDPAAERRYDERLDRLQAADHWIVEGRLAIRDGDEGGSGKLRWQAEPASSRLDFHGALGRGAWRLMVSPDEAVLTLADGEVYRAASVDRLIAERIGWPVPVAELSWWIRGLAAPGRQAQRALDEAGVLLELQQAGWSIEFDRYREFGQELMPGLVVARRGARQVKFAIRDWTLSDGVSVDG
ncbi:MAG: lipoprotein insertase outer membrane protein LolB [Xanthomonadales bacterium]